MTGVDRNSTEPTSTLVASAPGGMRCRMWESAGCGVVGVCAAEAEREPCHVWRDVRLDAAFSTSAFFGVAYQQPAHQA